MDRARRPGGQRVLRAVASVTPAQTRTLTAIEAELARLIRHDDESVVHETWIRQRYDLGLAGWTCPACGKEALPGDRFCTKCGTPIKPVQPEAAPARARPACVNCGSALTANDVFCSRCGTRVRTEL